MDTRSPRNKRLESDYKQMHELVSRSDFITFEVVDYSRNLPPEKYIVTYHCRGIARIDGQRQPVFSDFHKVYIELHLDYPGRAPLLNMRTPIWHPNVKHTPPYNICIDPHWWAPSRTLESLVRMVGEMIQYKLYHAERTPPGPIDIEVAEWVQWAESRGILSKRKPVDTRELLKPGAMPRKPRVKIIEGTPAKPKIRLLDDL